MFQATYTNSERYRFEDLRIMTYKLYFPPWDRIGAARHKVYTEKMGPRTEPRDTSTFRS